MPYADTLRFLYGLQKHGIKLGLDTELALLERLGRPQDRYPTLHIGGTNGKGSTAAMAASILRSAGYRVGLYTSPHLVDFTERIRVDGESIPPQDVSRLMEGVRDAIDPSHEPTFFEATTALAFQYFAEAHVDVAVIEVGMGGRFDATNVVTPLVSAITNVALDHQVYLGSTVSAIAYEKAGIIKPQTPVVTGVLSLEAAGVIESVAIERQAPHYSLGRSFKVGGDSTDRFHYEGIRVSFSDLSCPLPGGHQIDNAACALSMLEVASDRGIRFSEEAVRAGLRSVRWEGRLEVVDRHPLTLLDGAHNPAAAEAVATYLTRLRRTHAGSRIILILSLMRDKDRERFFQALLPVADEVILTQAAIPRAATVEELRGSVASWSGPVHIASSPGDALALARRIASDRDVVCATGSLMLIGDLKALLRGCELSTLRG